MAMHPAIISIAVGARGAITVFIVAAAVSGVVCGSVLLQVLDLGLEFFDLGVLGGKMFGYFLVGGHEIGDNLAF
jgi:hypothetical protein